MKPCKVLCMKAGKKEIIIHGATTGQRQPLLARYRAILSRAKQHELLQGLACASLLGFMAGLVARSLMLVIAVVREVSGQGYGLTHIILGLATGYGLLHESHRGQRYN